MEIIEKKVIVKLDKEERNDLLNTMDLIQRMLTEVPCANGVCPFKVRCDARDGTECLLRNLAEDLKYINNICD